MKIAVFSAQPYDRESLSDALINRFSHLPVSLEFHDLPLSVETSGLARDCGAVCVFVNDLLDVAVLQALAGLGVRAVLLRCAGFNNLDRAAASQLDLFVARVPAYSPEAVAEFSVALVLTLGRRTHRAYNRVREGNFALNGLLGFTLHGKTVGVVGTGKIGLTAARIFTGFGCHLLGYDPFQTDAFTATGGEYVGLDELLARSDVVSLYCPLVAATKHIINSDSLEKMKPGAMLVNTSRGGLIDTAAVIAALKARKLGALALDVYERESSLFFQDRSQDVIIDDVFQRLMTFPNVLVTGHQAFFTIEALAEIADTTFANLECFLEGKDCPNIVK